MCTPSNTIYTTLSNRRCKGEIQHRHFPKVWYADIYVYKIAQFLNVANVNDLRLEPIKSEKRVQKSSNEVEGKKVCHQYKTYKGLLETNKVQKATNRIIHTAYTWVPPKSWSEPSQTTPHTLACTEPNNILNPTTKQRPRFYVNDLPQIAIPYKKKEQPWMYLIAPCLTILHNHLVYLKLVHLKDVAKKKTS